MDKLEQLDHVLAGIPATHQQIAEWLEERSIPVFQFAPQLFAEIGRTVARNLEGMTVTADQRTYGVHPDFMTDEGILATIAANPEPLPPVSGDRPERTQP